MHCALRHVRLLNGAYFLAQFCAVPFGTTIVNGAWRKARHLRSLTGATLAPFTIAEPLTSVANEAANNGKRRKKERTRR